MAGKRGVRMAWRKPTAVNSLQKLQALLDRHHEKRALEVRVEALFGLREASSIQSLLRHQEEERGWKVTGMRRLDAFVHVEKMIGASAALLDEAIAYMEAAAARSAEDNVDVMLSARGFTSDDTVPAASARSFASDDDEFGSVPADPCLFADDAEPVARATAASDVARDERVVATKTLSPRAMLPNDTVVSPLDGIELVPDDRVHSINDSSSARHLAEAMLQAGTGQKQGLPPGLLHIAHQVLDAGTLGDFVRVMLSARGLTSDDTVAAASARSFASDDDEFGSVPADPCLFADDAEPVARATAASDVGRDERVVATKTLSPRAMLADRMLEMGTGLRAQALSPPPAMVDLAARVVSGDSPRRDFSPAVQRLFTHLLDSGTALRHHPLGGPNSKMQRAVQGLGCQMEDLAAAVLTQRHPTELMIGYLRTVRLAVETVLDTGVSGRDMMI